MFGLAVMVAFGLYLLLSYIVVRMAAGYARRHGRSTARWGWGAAVVMYLLVFWDWIPTIIAHRYYCATEAGIWVYKSFDQWRQDNAGVADSLVKNKVAPIERHAAFNSHIDTYRLNQRIYKLVRHTNISTILNVYRNEQEIFDSKDNEVIMRYVDFSTAQIEGGGGWFGWKFWLHRAHCSGGEARYGEFVSIKRRFQGGK